MSVSIPYLGKPAERVTVGPSKGFDYKSIQSAIDAITDATAEKPYVVDLAPGIYDEQVTMNESHVHLTGVPGRSIIRHDDDSDADAATLTIAGSAIVTSVENVTILRTGTANGASGGAIKIGGDTLGGYDSGDGNLLANVLLRNVRAQAHGLAVACHLRDAGYTAADLPIVDIVGCVFESDSHVAYFTGTAKLRSHGNIYRCVGSGPVPYITEDLLAGNLCGVWLSSYAAPPEDAFQTFHGDRFEVDADANLGGGGPTKRMLAVRILASGAYDIAPTRFVGCQASVEYTHAGTTGGTPEKTSVIVLDSFLQAAEDSIVWTGGSIVFRQSSAGNISYQTGAVVVKTSNASYLKIHGTTVEVIDDASSMTTPRSIFIDTAAHTVEAVCYSDRSVLINGGGGSITAAPTVP